MGVSMKAENLQQTGLLDDADVTITDAAYCMFQYPGTTTITPAARLLMTDPEGKVHEQYWSVGDAKKMVPSADGTTIEPAPGITNIQGFGLSTNWGVFLAELGNAGFPQDKLGDSIKDLIGLGGHVVRKKVERKSKDQTPEQAKKQADNGVLVFNKIHKLPWEAGTTAPSKVAGKITPTAANTPAATSGGAKAKAFAVIANLLATDPAFSEGIPKAQLSKAVFKVMAKDPSWKEVMGFLVTDEFLLDPEAPFLYDGSTITPAP